MTETHTTYRTYLPVPSSARVFERLFERDYEFFAQPLPTHYPYERVGFDRLLAILLDLQRLGIQPPARVLDVGCSSGLFSLGLAAAGYRAVGVDNNIAADVQGFYPEQPLQIAERLRQELSNADVTFVQGDVATALAEQTGVFDVCLLLSVVHQWFAGYALTGIGTKPLAEIEHLLHSLVARVTQVLYYEGPEEDEAAHAMQLSLPDWFVDVALARRVTPIAASPAANGDLRTLYRVEMR